MYRSKTHPQFDMIIDFVTYYFDENNKIENLYTIICWCNINPKAFSSFVDEKLGQHRKGDTTYPYAFYGECGIASIKQRIRKYNLEYIGMSDDDIKVYKDDEYEYVSGFANKHSKLSY